MLYGYGSIILDGALVTIEQALLSVALSFLLGLVGAAAKSSQSKSAKLLSGIYTTLIRGVPDLVLMDVGLPDTDGREVVRSLRKGGFKSPIIMLTGHDTDADTILGLEAGANDYVTNDLIYLRDSATSTYTNQIARIFKHQAASAMGSDVADINNDGWLDTFTANGTIITLEGHQNAFPYDQHRLLFRNLGNGRFENVTAKAGSAFTVSESGRGAAFGDVDNDGDIDLLYGASKTPEREAFAQFSLPYRVEQMLLLTQRTDPPQPAQLSLRRWLASPNANGNPRVLGVILGFYYGPRLDPIVHAPVPGVYDPGPECDT